MKGRYELIQGQWEAIGDPVERKKKRTGPRLRDDRELLNGMFWVLCSGASWRDLPERYGPWQAVYDRYRTLREDGTLDRVLERLQIRLNDEGLIELDTSSTAPAFEQVGLRLGLKKGLPSARALSRWLRHEAPFVV